MPRPLVLRRAFLAYSPLDCRSRSRDKLSVLDAERASISMQRRAVCPVQVGPTSRMRQLQPASAAKRATSQLPWLLTAASARAARLAPPKVQGPAQFAKVHTCSAMQHNMM